MNRLFKALLIYSWALATQVHASDTQQAAIASAHPLATDAGLAILAKGGNAFDAAVTVTSVLAVVEPFGSGLGGGGFFLLHQAGNKESKNVFIDAREVAPIAATKNMYLSEQGRVIDKASLLGPKAAGIPGEPAALVHLAQKYGNLPLATTLAPAIAFAEKGFTVDKAYIKAMGYRHKDFLKFETSQHFLDNGQVPKADFRLVQPALAKTLKALADEGHNGFYKGSLAQQMVESVQADGGLWSLEDLAGYTIKERKPLEGEYHGWKIVTAPPPSAGGLALLTSLNVLKRYEQDPLSESDQIHLIVESLRRAYCDRVKYVGDPDFTHVPISTLLSEAHMKLITKKLSLQKATPSSTLQCGVPSRSGDQTTHFSIMDANGNRVAATLSINQYFGSAYVEPNSGLLLNNEMDDFSSDLGAQNLYGLIGHASNLIEPRKRPVSSMTPTFIESNRGIGILGTPGGSRIPSMVLLALLETDKQDSPLAWVGRKRFHHQYMPDVISFEPEAFSPSVIEALSLRGHRLEPTLLDYGNMQLVFWDSKSSQLKAVSDPRGQGKAKVIPMDGSSND